MHRRLRRSGGWVMACIVLAAPSAVRGTTCPSLVAWRVTLVSVVDAEEEERAVPEEVDWASAATLMLRSGNTLVLRGALPGDLVLTPGEGE